MSGPVRILATCAGIVVAAAALVLLVLLPLHRKTQADLAAITDRRAQLIEFQRVARRITDLQGEIKRLEEALAFFENRLPEEREVDVILREVWLIAESKSLTPRSVRTSKPESSARCHSQPITLTLEGSFSAFYDFLLGLERLPRITRIRQMQISKVPQTEGQVQADLQMDIFFEKKQ